MKEQGNTSWDEQVAVTRHLKNRDISMGKIIIDLANKKVVRNSWNKQSSFEELFKYFCGNYPKHTKDIMLQIDPAFYFNLFPEQVPPTLFNTPTQTIESTGSEFSFAPTSEVRVVDTVNEVK